MSETAVFFFFCFFLFFLYLFTSFTHTHTHAHYAPLFIRSNVKIVLSLHIKFVNYVFVLKISNFANEFLLLLILMIRKKNGRQHYLYEILYLAIDHSANFDNGIVVKIFPTTVIKCN